MQELFPLGEVVPREDLVGREEAILGYMQRLESGQHLLVPGPRRTGKSSVLAEVVRRMQERGYIGVQVDLLLAPSIEHLAELLIERTLEASSGISGALRLARRWLQGSLPDLRLRAKWQELEWVGELVFDAARQPRVDLGAALDFPERVAERTGRKAVVVLDEFQAADRFGQGIFEEFRGHVIQQHRTVYAFLGSQRELLRSLFSDSHRPLYRLGWEEPLPPVPKAEWIAYLRGKYARVGLEAEDVLDSLVLRTGAQPLDTMLLAQELYYLVGEKGRANRWDLEQAAARVLLRLQRDFLQEWACRRPVEQMALAALAKGEAPYAAVRKHPRQITAALSAMVDDGILEHPSRGKYYFVEPLLATWIRDKIGGRQEE